MKLRVSGGLVAYLVGTALLVVACIHDFNAATSGSMHWPDSVDVVECPLGN